MKASAPLTLALSPRAGRGDQRGAATMLIALMVLMSLALIGMTGSRLVMTQHRISANAARADAAFAAAEAGVQNALVYLRPNRSVMTDVHLGGWDDSSSSVKWTACSTRPTAIPCGNGASNLYGSGWEFYGPIPNQTTVPGDYTVSSYYLSNTINAADLDLPDPKCTTLNLTQSGLPRPLTSTLNSSVDLVNTVLSALATVLGQPGLALQRTMCLPINFSQMPWTTWPGQTRPSLTIVASAAPTSDPAGGAAVVQQVVATTNLFYNVPPAALMVNGTVGFGAGDIRLWGNMRPPTESPMDFSVLNLNNVGGYDVSTTLNSTVGSEAAAIASAVNVSFAPVLNVTSAQVVAFDWDLTFPLTIWSAAGTTLSTTSYASTGILSAARTCNPPWGGSASSTCFPLSQNVTAATLLLGTRAAPLELPDIQDPVNLANVVTGLIGSSVPAFPSDLFAFIFGYPSANASRIQELATALTNCTGVTSGAFYWVTGDCALSGTVGSAAAPVLVVATGNVSFGNNTDFYGLLYLRGSSAKTITGYNSGQRPTVHGAIVSEGAVTASNSFNVVYDVNAIRKAGFRSGGYAPMPGGWNDAVTGP